MAPPLFQSKDNEFIAWYPNNLTSVEAGNVWKRKDAGFYIHIPFCDAICDYCGFSVQRIREANIERYILALEKEIALHSERMHFSARNFICGHFGGGTPSAISAEAFLRIKRAMDKAVCIANDAEITIEVNPISFTEEKARTYKEAGINRLSFGMQTFSDRHLATIGRPHRKSDIERTLLNIFQNKWQNFSLDLIYGIPGQTIDELTTDLSRAIDTGAPHITCFRLEIIPFTKLKLREAAGELPQRLTLDLLDAMDSHVSSTLLNAGYKQYGAFNFAKPGFESVHNRIAFEAPQLEYIGLGNSAYSYMEDYVFCNKSSIEEYCSDLDSGQFPIALARKVNAREKMARYFVLGLKMQRVSRSKFEIEFGLSPQFIYGEQIDALMYSGYLIIENDDYVVTEKGTRYINNIAKMFYTAENIGVRQHLQFEPNITSEQVMRYAKLARDRKLIPLENELSD